MKAQCLVVIFAGCLVLLQCEARADDLRSLPTGVGIDSIALALPLLSAFDARIEARALLFGSASLAPETFGDDGRLDLRTYGALLDLYPLRHGPRISAGLVGSSTRIGLRATCPSTCVIGDVANGTGRRGDRTFKKPKPYLGLGYGDSLGGLPLSFGLDVGVLLQNPVRNGLDPNGSQAGAGQGSGEFESLTKNFGYNPVVQLSLGWRF